MNASGPNERQKQWLAECDVEARQRQDDEASRRHPVDEALEAVEAFNPAAGSATLDHHHAAPKIENNQNGKHTEQGDAANPAQGDFMEMTPLAACGLLQHVRLHVRNSATPLNSAHFLKQLLLLHRQSGRIYLRTTLLCGCGRRDCNDNCQCKGANNETEPFKRLRHAHPLLLFHVSCCRTDGAQNHRCAGSIMDQVAIDSR